MKHRRNDETIVLQLQRRNNRYPNYTHDLTGVNSTCVM